MSKFPVPGTRRTRAIASLRRPVMIFAAVVATYDSSSSFLAGGRAGAFLAAGLGAAVFLAAVFLAVDFGFEAAVFFAAGFFAAGFLAAGFFAVGFFAEGFFAAFFSAGDVVEAFRSSGVRVVSDVPGFGEAVGFCGNPSHTGGCPKV